MKTDFAGMSRTLSLAALAVLGVSTLGGLSAPVFAEKPTRPAGKAQGRGHRGQVGKMAQELGLTARQKTRLQTIMKESRQQAKAVRQNKKLSETQKREKMRSIRQASRQRTDAVLTDTQRKKLREMRRENRGHRNRPARNKA